MKQNDVPQEDNKTLDGNKKAVYAVDKDGQYGTIASDGWNVEEIVTSQAVEEFERLAEDALRRAEDKLCSYLEYHMYKSRMDIPLLSQSTGFFKWTIKKDFDILRFSKMTRKRASVYAETLNISLETFITNPSW